jgi:hypothetical protein
VRLELTQSVTRRAAAVSGALADRQARELLVRMLVWRLFLPALKRRLPIGRLVMVMRPGARHVAAPVPPPERVVELARLACRPRLLVWRENCLERSLIAYRYLLATGARPSLALGIGHEHAATIGHAWITIEGAPVGEAGDPLARFREVISYDPEGRRAGP